MCICIYVGIHIYIYRICIHIYIYIGCVYVYIYIYITGSTVSILIRSAKGLRNADKTMGVITSLGGLRGPSKDLSDPYCVCTLLGPKGIKKSEFKTETVQNNLEPEWKTGEKQFTNVQVGDTIEFQVWDEDPGKSPDKLGKVSVKVVEDLLKDGLDNPKLKLEESEKAGEGKDASISVKITAV